jgi:hypothetical protein
MAGIFVGRIIRKNYVKKYTNYQFQYPQKNQKRLFYALHSEKFAADNQHKQRKQIETKNNDFHHIILRFWLKYPF